MIRVSMGGGFIVSYIKAGETISTQTYPLATKSNTQINTKSDTSITTK
jgi:hypothetical protein